MKGYLTVDGTTYGDVEIRILSYLLVRPLLTSTEIIEGIYGEEAGRVNKRSALRAIRKLVNKEMLIKVVDREASAGRIQPVYRFTTVPESRSKIESLYDMQEERNQVEAEGEIND